MAFSDLAMYTNIATYWNGTKSAPMEVGYGRLTRAAARYYSMVAPLLLVFHN